MTILTPQLPNHILSEDEAKELLAPYLKLFKKSLNDGFRAWELLGEKAPELRVCLSKQCRARFIYDHIVRAAKEHFQEIENIRFKEKSGLLTVHVELDHTVIVLRFKKLDDNKKSRSYPTANQLAFSLQLSLPGWPDATRLVAGYQLDVLGLETKDLLITCPIGHRVEWFFSIKDVADIDGTMTMPANAAPSSSGGGAIYKAKDSEKVKSENEPIG